MIINKICNFIVALLVCTSSMAQVNLPKVIPPSPDVASLGKFIESPVNYHTGVLNITVPIYNIIDRDLDIPIYLAYHASGLKVQELPGWVGAGWALNAGGVVSRSMRGLPDEWSEGNREGYIGAYDDIQYLVGKYPSFDFSRFGQDATILTDFYEGVKDGEPDLFFFNAGSYSGTLVIDPITQKFYSIPYQNLKIEPSMFVGTNGMINGFKITTPEGIVYEFGGTGYVESTAVEIPNEPDPPAYNSAWFLRKITSPTGSVIDFFYSPFFSQQEVFLSETRTDFIPLSQISECSGFVGNNVSFSYSNTDVSSMKIDRIVFNNGKAKLSFYSSGRRDSQYERKLDFIELTDHSGNVVKRFNFEYDYFNSSSNDPFLLRLKLNKFYEEGYNNPDKSYTFHYFDQDVPSRHSLSQDHWGYFNGKPNNTLIPEMQTGWGTMPGGNRNPDPVKMLGGALKKIVYPTLGHSEFEYETHNVDNNSIGYQGVIGGLRIKKVKLYDESVLKLETEYSYESGYLLSAPRYDYTTDSYIVEGNSFAGEAGVLKEYHCSKNFIRSSFNRSSLGTGGSPVVYGKVTVRQKGVADNGEKTYKFNTIPDLGLRAYPFPPATSMEWMRGQLLEEASFKRSGNSLIKLDEKKQYYNNPLDTEHIRKKILSLKVGQAWNGERLRSIGNYFYDYFLFETVNVYSAVTRLDSYSYTLYDDASVPFHTSTTYLYDNPVHLQPTRVVTTGSDGLQTVAQTKYAADFAGTEYGSDLLRAAHMHGQPLEQTVTKGTGVGRTATAYVGSHGNIVVDRVMSAPTGGTLETRLKYHAYDDRGNVLEVSMMDGGTVADVRQSYIWGYNKTLPIAKVVNARHSEVMHTSFEDNNSAIGATAFTGRRSWSGQYTFSLPSQAGNYVLTYWTKNGTEDWRYVEEALDGITPNAQKVIGASGLLLDEVRLHPLGALMTTYTYDPLVGMTSATDENGVTGHYHYDGFGRLRYIADHRGNILKQFQYHYKQ